MNRLDLELGFRMLVKYPGLTIVGGLAMAFAIWVGVVIYVVVGLFVSPTLPLPQGARLVEIREMDVAANAQAKNVLHDFLEWRQTLRSLADVGAWRNSSRNLIISAAANGRQLRLRGLDRLSEVWRTRSHARHLHAGVRRADSPRAQDRADGRVTDRMTLRANPLML